MKTATLGGSCCIPISIILACTPLGQLPRLVLAVDFSSTVSTERELVSKERDDVLSPLVGCRPMDRSRLLDFYFLTKVTGGFILKNAKCLHRYNTVAVLPATMFLNIPEQFALSPPKIGLFIILHSVSKLMRVSSLLKSLPSPAYIAILHQSSLYPVTPSIFQFFSCV